MRMVIQKVSSCRLIADGVDQGKMGDGLLCMVGIKDGDENEKVMSYMLDKLMNLRIFEDEEGKLNLSVIDKQYGVYIVSNFTLYGDCRHGRRPSYSSGAGVEKAHEIYDKFIAFAKKNAKVPLYTGVFQAMMDIQVDLSGPVTLLLDSDKVF